MAKAKRGFILISCILSTIACMMTFVALGTEEWVVSDTRWSQPENTFLNDVHYGLFSGTLKRSVTGTYIYHIISMTCDMGENACAMLCGTDTQREEQLNSLIRRQSVNFDAGCPSVPRSFMPHPGVIPATRDAPEPVFINAGILVSTIFFLVVSGICGVATAVFSMWNVVDSPVNPFFNILGLYVYNGVAATSALLVSVLWGVHFGATLIRNVGILETVTGQMNSEGRASLGYSYWIIMISWLFHFTNIALLYARQHLLNQEPSIANVHYDEGTDSGIIIY